MSIHSMDISASLPCSSVLRSSVLLSEKAPASAVSRRFPWLVVLTALCFIGSLFFTSTSANGQDTPDYFRTNCFGCHTIGGGRLAGPDLKDVTKRQDREWLARFLKNPRAVIDSGDSYAKKILEESRNLVMPTPPSIRRAADENLPK